MTVELFDATLKDLRHRTPLGSFTVELEDGQVIEVDQAQAVAFRGGVATYVESGGRMTFFDHHEVKRITPSPVDQSAAGGGS